MNKQEKTKTYSFRLDKNVADLIYSKSKEMKINKSEVISAIFSEYQKYTEKSNNVDIKDYDKDVHAFYVGLQSVGIQCTYIVADLIYMLNKFFSEKGGEMNIGDCISLKYEHELKWKTYFELKNKSKNEG